ncbi:MAG: dipeptidyl peptidase 3 [Chitinophagales bacterium]|nr:dipeptidyl peptidase 3 [Chitinophagales bacterium]
MSNIKLAMALLISSILITACNESNKTSQDPTPTSTESGDFQYNAESFADLQILRYQVPGWDELSLQQKEFIYYLSEASLAGRDIIWDQRGKYNLTIRKVIEAVYATYSGEKSGENWEKFKTWAGQVWFSNGIYHHYGNDKLIPAFDAAYFAEIVKNSDASLLPLSSGETADALVERLGKVIFDKDFAPKMADFSPGIDHIVASSNNFYEGVTQAEVDAFYATFPKSDREPEWGLNSKVVKENGKITEKVWKSGGMYGAAIDKMIYWLEKAIPLSENDQQKKALTLLVEYYKTGDLHKWDEYAIAWTQNTNTVVDFTNGFIEVYGDAIGKKGSYESIVSIKDFESSRRIEAIAKEAQWFEDNSPLMPEHKKKNVKGINAKVINVVTEAGDASPSTPIGINLPNSDWLRKEHGSKSVSLGNIISAYNNSAGSGMTDEFGVNDEVKARIKKHGSLASDLHTDMHECIGHASGQINPGVGTPDKTLKNYASTLEEARADLVALYYVTDQKLIDIGVMESIEVGKAEYDSYMMNGLMTQLVRIKPGDNIEEAHMRNRALIAYWALEKGAKENVVQMIQRDGKTFVQVNDYDKLRVLFGDLLREIQRIKSEGDYEAGKKLVEDYGVKVNPELHKEVLDRYAKLNVKPYKGFIQPVLTPIEENGKITDIKIDIPVSFYDQMLEYGKKYAFLPVMN